jgi:chromosomal replication initiator protein
MSVATIEGRRVTSKLIYGEALATKEMDRHAHMATRGSRKLRNAILLLQGRPIPHDDPIKRQELCPTCSAPFNPSRRLVSDIQQTVAAYFGLHAATMTSSDRRSHITRARQIAMYLASELTGHSIAEIGRRFKRDHTTVLHAMKAVAARVDADNQVAFDVSVLRERMGG